MRVRLLAFGLVVFASAAAGFSMPGVVVRGGMGSVKMQETTSPVTAPARALDPLDLTTNKAMQTCPLRPYLGAAQNGGLETATLALG